jgi:hypothetical protein
MSMKDAGRMATCRGAEGERGEERQIVVARLGDDVTVKRLKRTRSGIERSPRTRSSRRSSSAPAISRSRGRGRADPQQHADVSGGRHGDQVPQGEERRMRAAREPPNIGPALAVDLRRIGIARPADLRGQTPMRSIDVWRATGQRQTRACSTPSWPRRLLRRRRRTVVGLHGRAQGDFDVSTRATGTN